ncbi:hypothetical protein ASG63_03025 [Methylobacterium sp. Leaf94]|nr:hypothetical protein ASF20_20685 [Methylobacterium sp. Leaf88]KQU27607.1 hypothetical protein ASG63_03025 [Methylobacterium sp. Leaf94]
MREMQGQDRKAGLGSQQIGSDDRGCEPRRRPGATLPPFTPEPQIQAAIPSAAIRPLGQADAQ